MIEAATRLKARSAIALGECFAIATAAAPRPRPADRRPGRPRAHRI